jgi:hypothetical protein
VIRSIVRAIVRLLMHIQLTWSEEVDAYVEELKL